MSKVQKSFTGAHVQGRKFQEFEKKKCASGYHAMFGNIIFEDYLSLSSGAKHVTFN